MTTPPPYLTQSHLRGRRRLRGRGAVLRALALLIPLAAVGAGVFFLTGRSHATARDRHAAVRAPVHAPARPLSADGLPLSAPALKLGGISEPWRNPVKLNFHVPPRAGLLFNLDSGQVLWEHEPHERLPIASLTKMMTALIAVESDPPSARVLITRRAIDTNGSKVGVLPVRRHVRLESLLYGLLLPSGNDAAVAIAQHVSGSVARFVARMNAEAAHLGMGCTRYNSPHGFYDAGNFSCAADLAVLAHVDMDQPRIERVTRTLQAILPFPIKGGKLYLYNNNPMLIYHYPGATGLKTGYTEAAGRCLVATAERGGVRLGVVLLHSPAPGRQARQLLDDAFERVYHQRPVHEPGMPDDA
jgi:serine-type D-Ala-D-Ala carboxypeptidase (penicillin-binding protein 5/6)